MTFKVDENLPAEVVDLLKAAGHDAETVVEEGLRGVDDPALAAKVQSERRAIVTLDLGFGDIRAYPPDDYAGIVIIRGKRQDKRSVLALAARFVPLLDTEPLVGHIWIVEADRVRIR